MVLGAEKDMPGLAHFCEHMLFLGTEAFPDEAEYKRYVKRPSEIVEVICTPLT